MLDKSGCFLFGLHSYLQKPLCKVTNTTLDHCFGKRVKGVGLIVFIGGMFSSRPPKVPFQPLPPAFLPSLLSPPSFPSSFPFLPPSLFLPLPPLPLPLPTFLSPLSPSPFLSMYCLTAYLKHKLLLLFLMENIY